jgi:hypothetical protein
MYNHVEMIVVLYLNFFRIRNMLPKRVYVCALEASSRMYERREGRGKITTLRFMHNWASKSTTAGTRASFKLQHETTVVCDCTIDMTRFYQQLTWSGKDAFLI